MYLYAVWERRAQTPNVEAFGLARCIEGHGTKLLFHASALGDSFVEACDWAQTSLYGNTPLWRALWNNSGRASRRRRAGTLVVYQAEASGRHQGMC